MICRVESLKAIEITDDDIYEWVDKFHAELVEAKVTAKLTKRAANSMQIKLDKANTIASKRLHLVKSLKVDLDEVTDDLVDKSKAWYAIERMGTIKIEIRKVNDEGMETTMSLTVIDYLEWVYPKQFMLLRQHILRTVDDVTSHIKNINI